MQATYPGFDPEKIQEFFRLGEDVARAASEFATLDPKSVDPARLYEAQRSNMEALLEANRSAAQAYEDLFRRQVEVLRATAERVQARFEAVREDPAAAMDPEKQAAETQAALAEAARQLTELAEAAARVNADALGGVGRQVAASMTALATATRK